MNHLCSQNGLHYYGFKKRNCIHWKPMYVASTTLYVDYAIYIYIYMYFDTSFYALLFLSNFLHVNSRNMYLIGIWRFAVVFLFVVVNSYALAQAGDFRIERRHVVFLCWMQDSNPEGLWNQIFSRLNACWQTDWAIEDQAKKLELDSPSLWSASIQPTWPHCHLAFAPGSGDIHICCC